MAAITSFKCLRDLRALQILTDLNINQIIANIKDCSQFIPIASENHLDDFKNDLNEISKLC
ncbi:hypothetical protein AGMMS49574_05280 [Bacteroidia bacterium]|nr:hypothetical protein AGMMS49574_05280 [Bacteroidia bacterium]